MQKKQQLSTALIMGLALLSASSALATDMYLPAMPGIAADLGTTAPMVQFTLSSFMAGMAIGQLIIGPLSDQLGRKGLLVAGAVAALIASAVCALAPSISVLIIARLVQGLGGGACVVIARAIVPDLERGQKAAQAFALLMIIQGIAPVVAPLIGGVLVGPFDWRGIFWALALVNFAQLLVAVLQIKESKPVEERTAAGLGGMLSNYVFVLKNPQFLAYAFTLGLSFGAMFSYISASPFVLQDQMGIPVLLYSIIFGVNAFGLIVGGMINRRLLQRIHPHRIMQTVLASFTVLCALLLIEALFINWIPLFLVLLFLIVSHIPMVMANATALGTEVVRSRAGSGSAILGFVQFTMGALVSSLVGLGADKAVTMGIAMIACALLACGCAYLAGRKGIPEMR
ncbi:multidrug effflux MFS transporter [Corynebacterium glutamicum]|uniref:multidrug effflux MFS transporter n=1 Tax=Corynebacterium glutamicum TaxID=1718 RepID=UPI000942BDD2|nr:multidrug effflux MFS transporter [Corynebacterium glutamicum]OKX84722.1 Bcr/CflA family drug resistance efflux transporter [Corynebacterium glutamicum]